MDAKIQPNARKIRQIRNICVSGSEMQRLRYPACNRKGSTRCGGFGIEDGGAAKKAFSHPAGSSGKIHVFLSSGTDFFLAFSSFPAHLVGGSEDTVLEGIVGWFCGAGRKGWLVGWFCKQPRPVIRTHRIITINNEPAGRLGGDAGPATISAPSVSGRRPQRDGIRHEHQFCSTHQHCYCK